MLHKILFVGYMISADPMLFTVQINHRNWNQTN